MNSFTTTPAEQAPPVVGSEEAAPTPDAPPNATRPLAPPRTLLDRHARQRRVAVLERSELDPANDFAAATAFDPGCHTRRVPRPPAAVLQHLTTVEHLTDPATGRVGRQTLPLVLPQGGHLEVPWGLVALIAQAERCPSNHPASRTDDSVHLRPLPTVSDPLVVDQLLAHRRLVVRHGRGVGVARLIAALAEARPKMRIAVIASRRRDVGHLTAGLTALGVDAVGFYSAGDYDARPPRVVVGTPAAITSSAAQHAGCSVVVALDAVHFVGSGGASARYERGWANAYWLGLVPPDRRVSPLERDRLVCMFGPAVLDLPAHGAVSREVVFAHQPITLPAGRGGERVIMRLATDLASQAPEGRANRFAVVRQAVGIAGPVAVLAHDRPHRLELERATRPEDRGRVPVVTPAELADLPAVGILVRADRRPQQPPLGDRVLVQPQTERAALLLVDVVGPEDGRLVDDRVAGYRAEGWVSLDADRGGWAEWERWSTRRQPGRQVQAGRTGN